MILILKSNNLEMKPNHFLTTEGVYDTVFSFLNAENGGVFTPSSLNCLSNIKETQKQDGTMYFTGDLGAIKVVFTEHGISVKGSFPKWYLDDNIQTLTRGDMQRATEKLSDVLHLPMNKAKVGRIDLAKNLLMKFEPSIYYPYLGEAQHYQRLVQPKSVYYKNTLKTKLFYDKVAECKSKGVIIPQVLSSSNLLRYELRFLERLPKQFNLAEVLLETLHGEDFYMAILDRWKAEYQMIKKIHDIQTLDYDMVKSKKQLHQQGILFYIEKQGGILKVLEEVEEAQKKGKLTRKQAFDLRNEYREASQATLLTSKSELIAELDTKINSAIRHYR